MQLYMGTTLVCNFPSDTSHARSWSQSFGSDRIAHSHVGGHTYAMASIMRQETERDVETEDPSTAGLETTGNGGLVTNDCGVFVDFDLVFELVLLLLVLACCGVPLDLIFD